MNLDSSDMLAAFVAGQASARFVTLGVFSELAESRPERLRPLASDAIAATRRGLLLVGALVACHGTGHEAHDIASLAAELLDWDCGL